MNFLLFIHSFLSVAISEESQTEDNDVLDLTGIDLSKANDFQNCFVSKCSILKDPTKLTKCTKSCKADLNKETGNNSASGNTAKPQTGTNSGSGMTAKPQTGTNSAPGNTVTDPKKAKAITKCIEDKCKPITDQTKKTKCEKDCNDNGSSTSIINGSNGLFTIFFLALFLNQ